jgi:tetratricopeptide (TPR) repeat protein
MIATAQVGKIVIPAGTDEDKALTAINAETDETQKIAKYEQFLKDFSSNPAAVAYGNWQLAQEWQTAGDFEKALAYVDKAVAASPDNLEILVTAVSIAQAAKDNPKAVEYAATGGAVFHSIATQPKPAGVSDGDFSTRVSEEERVNRPNYEFMEAAGYNAIAAVNDAKTRMGLIERYTPAFPASKFEEQISQLAMVSLQELNDPPRVIAYGEKTLKSNPESVPTLLLLANVYVEDSKQLAKALDYAGRAAKLAKGEEADAGDQAKLSTGMARSTLGYALLKQSKATLAVPELKKATELLASNEQVQQEALYRLAYAYALLAPPKRAEAREALNKCIAIGGPYKPLAEDLLQKVNTSAKK